MSATETRATVGGLRRGTPALGTLALAIGVASVTVGASTGVGALVVVLTSGALSPLQFAPFLALACWGYSLRFGRWHVLIRQAVPGLKLGDSFRAQAIGFGLSTTPGRVAELWKLHLVERASGAPAARGAGAMVVERLTDLLGFAALAAAGASGSFTGRPSLGVIAAGVLLAVALVARPLVARQRRLVASPLIRHLIDGGVAVAQPGPVGLGLILLVLGRAGDAFLLWNILAALGEPVPFSLALFAFASAGLVGGLSLLPGGLGVVEGAMVSLLVLGGTSVGTATLAVLLTRVLVLWIWAGLGLALFAADHLTHGLSGGTRWWMLGGGKES